METAQAKFEEWCLIEIFGHQRIAGRVTEQQIGGASFVRVDVPKDSEKAKGWKITRLYNPSAIYSITPTTEETARMVAKSIVAEPVTRWDVQDIVANSRKLGPMSVEAGD